MNIETNLLINGLQYNPSMKLEDFMIANGLTSFKASRGVFKEVKAAYSQAAASITLADASIKSARIEAARTKDGLVARQRIIKEGALDHSDPFHREAFNRLTAKEQEKHEKKLMQDNLFKAQVKARFEADKVRQERALQEAIERQVQEAEAEKLVSDLQAAK